MEYYKMILNGGIIKNTNNDNKNKKNKKDIDNIIKPKTKKLKLTNNAPMGVINPNEMKMEIEYDNDNKNVIKNKNS